MFNEDLALLGDALFFHSNVLHTSSDNCSANERRALVIAYNKASNDPGPHQKHPGYTHLDMASASVTINIFINYILLIILI